VKTSSLAVGEDGDWERGSMILGEYHVEDILGEGGMGKVYLLVRSRNAVHKFAVKRNRIKDHASRQNFLNELQTWIDLPEHPHLVPCRFFRTVGDELVIFAEYVVGGSLSERIQSGALHRLEDILDMAIQFAWGLQAMHDMGLVHQDVKPGNALIARDGTLRVSDFGLARARAASGEESSPHPQQSVLVSFGGMTRAYCSPEQANRQRLTPKTDIWSWGVSVLEMFTGEVLWSSGVAAPEALSACLEGQSGGNGSQTLPPMPPGVVKVLRRCFEVDPADRWPTLLEAADALTMVYQQVCGMLYHRAMSAMSGKSSEAAAADKRMQLGNVEWDDPMPWLAKVLKAVGCTPTEVERSIGSRKEDQSSKARAVADLAIFEEARAITERLIRDGQKAAGIVIAYLSYQQALIHNFTGDKLGAIKLYDQAIEIFEQLINEQGQWNLAKDLSKAYVRKALTVDDVGDKNEAVEACDRAIDILERLVNREGRQQLANDLADVYIAKAGMISGLDNEETSVAFYDRAIAIFERLVDREGRRDLTSNLARAYVAKANTIRLSGDDAAALILYDRAIRILERLVNEDGRWELAKSLSGAYVMKALAVDDSGDKDVAVVLCDQAIDILEQLVNEDGRWGLAKDLADVYVAKATMSIAGWCDKETSVVYYDRAIAIFERLVDREGQRDLTNNLARAYVAKANTIRLSGDDAAALILYDRAIRILERLVNEDGRWKLANDLTEVYRKRAITVHALSVDRTAIAHEKRPIEVLERLVDEDGRWNLADDLAKAYVCKAKSARESGNNAAAAALYDRAVEIVERSNCISPSPENGQIMVSAHMGYAEVLQDTGDLPLAKAHANRAVRLLEGGMGFYAAHGRLEEELTDARALRANILSGLGEREQ